MKVAVSIPDELHARADALARSQNTSRSRLYSDALREYLDRRQPDDVTAAIDSALALLDDDPDYVEDEENLRRFREAAARGALGHLP